MLGDQRVPLIDEINAQGEFTATTVSPDEFEEMWSRRGAKGSVNRR